MTSFLVLILAVTVATGSAASKTEANAKEASGKANETPAASTPSAGEELNPWATGITEEQAISKILTTDVADLTKKGKTQEATAAIDRAEKLLTQYTSENDIPEWEQSVARLYQLVETKRGSLKSKSGSGAAAGSETKLTSEQIKQLAEYRKTIASASAQAKKKQHAEAQTKAEAVIQSMDAWVAKSKVPAWHKSVAGVYQQAAGLLDETEAATGKTNKSDNGKERSLKVGDSAPPFSVAGLDGNPLSSKQLAGKWVVLDFWATWCGPCRAEMPHLQALQETYGQDSRFVMVSLTIDDKVTKPKAYVKENKLNWTHGFLGQGWRAPLLQRYGVHGIPSIFLISPQGKIAAVGLRGEALKKAVGKALGQSASSSK